MKIGLIDSTLHRSLRMFMAHSGYRIVPPSVGVISLMLIITAFWYLWRTSPSQQFLTVANPLQSEDSETGDIFPSIGNSLCAAFDKRLVRIIQKEKSRKEGMWRVYRGVLKDKYHSLKYKNISLRVLGAKSREFDVPSENYSSSFGTALCKAFRQEENCRLDVTLQKWDILRRVVNRTGILSADFVRDFSLPLRCASQRFVNRIVRRSASKKHGYVTLQNLAESDKISLLLRLKLAPKMWMNEAFPGNEGWPFGVNYGACGGIVVNKDDNSVALSALYHEPWESRVDMAAQLLEIAMHLTHNDDGYWISLRHLKRDDISRNMYGRIRISGVHRLEVYDHRAFEEDAHWSSHCGNWEETHNTRFVCAILEGTEERVGLLHDPEESQVFNTRMKEQLRKCQTLSSTTDHFNVVENIRRWLDAIRPCSEKFQYRFPDCQYT